MSPSDALSVIQGQNVQFAPVWSGMWIWIGSRVADGPGMKIDSVSAQAGVQTSWILWRFLSVPLSFDQRG